MLKEITNSPLRWSQPWNNTLTVKDFVKTPAARRVRGWPRRRVRLSWLQAGPVRHAGLVAELLIEDLSGIAVDVEYASEYSYRFGEVPEGCGSDRSVAVG